MKGRTKANTFRIGRPAPLGTLEQVANMFSELGKNNHVLRYLQTGYQKRIKTDYITKAIRSLLDNIRPFCFRKLYQT